MSIPEGATHEYNNLYYKKDNDDWVVFSHRRDFPCWDKSRYINNFIAANAVPLKQDIDEAIQGIVRSIELANKANDFLYFRIVDDIIAGKIPHITYTGEK